MTHIAAGDGTSSADASGPGAAETGTGGVTASAMDASSKAAGADLVIACLCAGWCRVCDGYRPAFEALAAEFPEHRLVWVDIEEQEALVDGLDIEQFPTLLMTRGAALRFYGVLPARIEVLRRTIRAAQVEACNAPDALVQAVCERLVQVLVDAPRQPAC